MFFKLFFVLWTDQVRFAKMEFHAGLSLALNASLDMTVTIADEGLFHKFTTHRKRVLTEFGVFTAYGDSQG